jgi:ATP-binding cassette subfamily A (ABC1) protein 3
MPKEDLFQKNINKTWHRAKAIIHRNFILLFADKKSLIFHILFANLFAIYFNYQFPEDLSEVPPTLCLTSSVVITNMKLMVKVIVQQVNERTRRFRPTFKLMGLSQQSYIIGTIIYFLIEATFFNAMTMIVLKSTGRIEYLQMPAVLLFAYSNIFYSLFISCF